MITQSLLHGIIASSKVQGGAAGFAPLGDPDAYLVLGKSSTQAVSNSLNLVTFDSVVASSGWSFSSGSSIVVPAGIDVVSINFISNLTAYIFVGDMLLVVEKNGADIFERYTDDQGWGPQNANLILPVAESDVLSFRFRSFNGGSNLSTQTTATFKGWAL